MGLYGTINSGGISVHPGLVEQCEVRILSPRVLNVFYIKPHVRNVFGDFGAPKSLGLCQEHWSQFIGSCDSF